MPTDVVQIGPLVIPEILFNAFVTLAAVLIGGLTSFLATTFAENRRWEQQKKDRLQEQQRDAIAHVLAWLDPLYEAVLEVASLVALYRISVIDQTEFEKRWPEQMPSLTEPPPRHRALLAEDTYNRSSDITDMLRALAEAVQFHGKIWEIDDQIEQRLRELDRVFLAYRKELYEEYRNTFK